MRKLALPDEYLGFARIDKSKGCTHVRMCVRVSALYAPAMEFQASAIHAGKMVKPIMNANGHP